MNEVELEYWNAADVLNRYAHILFADEVAKKIEDSLAEELDEADLFGIEDIVKV